MRYILRTNCTEISRDKQLQAAYEKALNRDFNGPGLDLLGSREPAHDGVKERYPRKSRYFAVVGQSFMKMVADRHGHAAYHNKH